MPERLGFVDSLLFGLLVSAQQDAERAYFEASKTGPYPERLDGVAEGLAVAVSLLGGEHPAIVRAKACEEIAHVLELEADQRATGRVAVARIRAARSGG